MIIYLILLTLLASIITTLSGFGLSTIMTPILVLFWPFKQTLIFLGILHWISNFAKVIYFRKTINWHLVLAFGIPATCASYVGAYFVFAVPENTLRIIFGIFFVLYAVIFLLHHKHQFLSLKSYAIPLGILSGFCAGLFGEQGAIRSSFLLAFNLLPVYYIGTGSFIALFVDTSRLFYYLYKDFSVALQLYLEILFSIPLIFIGTYIGRRLTKYIQKDIFNYFVIICLGIFGLYLIRDGFLAKL